MPMIVKGFLPLLVAGSLFLPADALSDAKPSTFTDAGEEASSGGPRPCTTRYKSRRELGRGWFLRRRWTLELYRDRADRRCLTDEWHKYGSIFRFRVHDRRPLLGILNDAVTVAPGHDDSVYVFDGYVANRVERLTFRLAGRTDAVRILRTPPWTRLRRDVFLHLVRGRRYDRDRTGVMRAFDEDGRLVARRVLRRRRFAEPIVLD